MLLSREDVHLIQTTLDADGMLICARWAIVSIKNHVEIVLSSSGSMYILFSRAGSKGYPFLLQEVLFEPNTYICDSRHNNLIAFQLEVGLLRRVLQAAGAHDADSLEVSSSDLSWSAITCDQMLHSIPTLLLQNEIIQAQLSNSYPSTGQAGDALGGNWDKHLCFKALLDIHMSGFEFEHGPGPADQQASPSSR